MFFFNSFHRSFFFFLIIVFLCILLIAFVTNLTEDFQNVIASVDFSTMQ